MAQIPDKLTGFMGYDEGEQMIGLIDVTLPTLTAMTDTISGAGIAGEIDSPVTGHFGSLTMTYNWRSLIQENIKYIAPETFHFDVRGSLQTYNHDTGEYEHIPIKVVARGKSKSLTIGTFTPANPMGTSGEIEVIYLKITIDRKEMLELDKFAYIFTVNGVDYLAKVRENLGLTS